MRPCVEERLPIAVHRARGPGANSSRQGDATNGRVRVYLVDSATSGRLSATRSGAGPEFTVGADLTATVPTDQSHGLAMASIIAARDNGEAVEGMANGAEIVPVTIDYAGVSPADFAAALEKVCVDVDARRRGAPGTAGPAAAVVSMSLAGPICEANDLLVKSLATRVAVFVAAGNSGGMVCEPRPGGAGNEDLVGSTPATAGTAQGVITVGVIDRDGASSQLCGSGHLASGEGPCVDVRVQADPVSWQVDSGCFTAEPGSTSTATAVAAGLGARIIARALAAGIAAPLPGELEVCLGRVTNKRACSGATGSERKRFQLIDVDSILSDEYNLQACFGRR